MESVDEPLNGQELTGLGGWLAFYVFGLFLAILLLVMGIFLVLSRNQSFVDAGLTAWTGTFMAIEFFMLLLVNAWLIRLFFQYKRIAIKYTKIYLVVSAVIAVVPDPLLTHGWTTTTSREGLTTPYAGSSPWLSTITSLAFSAVWYLYFQKSKRVRRTLVL